MQKIMPCTCIFPLKIRCLFYYIWIYDLFRFSFLSVSNWEFKPLTPFWLVHSWNLSKAVMLSVTMSFSHRFLVKCIYWLRRVWRYQRVIRIRKSKKNKQQNGQKNRTHNDLQNTKQKTKGGGKRPYLTGDEHWCFERVSSFNLEINPGIHHNTTQNTQDWATRTPLKTWHELIFVGKVSSSCGSSSTSRVIVIWCWNRLDNQYM